MRHEWAPCHDEAANHQLPSAAAFWIIRIVSREECSSLTQNLMQVRCSTHSVILNVTATQYTCSLSGVYRPHWLVQWSRHCSHVRTPVHSPWLPGHSDVAQTVLSMLTMAALFPDKPPIYCMRVVPYWQGAHILKYVYFFPLKSVVRVHVHLWYDCSQFADSPTSLLSGFQAPFFKASPLILLPFSES